MFIKFCFNDDLRRLSVDKGTLTYDLLLEKAKELYSIRGDIIIKFQDQEGDLLTLGGQDDLNEMLEHDIDQSNAIKLFLSITKTDIQEDGGESMEEMNTKTKKKVTDDAMIEILRDISYFICARDMANIDTWVSGSKSLITPSILKRLKKTKKWQLKECNEVLETVKYWSESDVANWLEECNLGEHKALFSENNITGEILLDMDQLILKEIGIASVGKRIQIIKAVETLVSK